MRYAIGVLLVVALLLPTWAQSEDSTVSGETEPVLDFLAPPEEGRSVVYFFTPFSVGSSLRIYDNDRILPFDLRESGKNTFYRYECEPGERVFWGALDKKEHFFKLDNTKVAGGHLGLSHWFHADLKPDHTYVVEVAYSVAWVQRRDWSEVLDEQYETTREDAWALLSEVPSTAKDVDWTPMKLLKYSAKQTEQAHKLGWVNERGEVLWPLSESKYNKAMKKIEKREEGARTPARS